MAKAKGDELDALVAGEATGGEDEFSEDRATGNGPAILGFEEIFPTERPMFTLKDNTQIAFKIVHDFDAANFGQLSHAQKQVEMALERLEKKHNDVHEQNRLRAAARRMVRMVLPDLPDEILNEMELGQLMKLIGWWNVHGGIRDGETAKK